MRRDFHTAEYLVELSAAKVLAIHDDRGNFLRVGNVFEGVRGKQNEVSELSFFHRSGLVFHSEKARGIDGRRLQRFKRSESGGHETLHLLVKAVPRKNMNTGRRIRSR